MNIKFLIAGIITVGLMSVAYAAPQAETSNKASDQKQKATSQKMVSANSDAQNAAMDPNGQWQSSESAQHTHSTDGQGSADAMNSAKQ